MLLPFSNSMAYSKQEVSKSWIRLKYGRHYQNVAIGLIYSMMEDQMLKKKKWERGESKWV